MRHAAQELYGTLVEFASAEALLAATRDTYTAGYREIESYSPFPVEGLSEAIGFTSNRVPLLTLLGGIIGGGIGYFLQWYSAVIDYPLNIGGRPLHSWPAFILVAFELAVLGAALAAVLGMLYLNGLPRLYHPVFNVRQFDRATRDRFFLLIKANDPRYAADRTRAFLETLKPLSISDVEN